MAQNFDPQLEKDYQNFLSNRLALNLASTSPDGFNEASFAPFVRYKQSCFIYLSALAHHYQNLLVNPQVGLLFIEDEADAKNPFSRERIQMQAEAEKLERDSVEHQELIPQFRSKFGKAFEVIEPLADFNFFKLRITNVRYIKGFAQAYDLVDDHFKHLGPPDSDLTKASS